MRRGVKKQRRFKFKRIFSTLFGSYVCMLCVPVLLTMWLMYLVTNLMMSNSVYHLEGNLEQGRMLFEKRIELMDSYAQNLVNDHTLKRIVRLKKLQPGDQNVWLVQQFQKKLNDHLPGDLDGYGVVLENGYCFRPTGLTYGTAFYFEKFRRYEQMTYEEWLGQSFSNEGPAIYPLQRIYSGKDSVYAMTYSYPIGKDQGNGVQASVQMLLTEDFLKEIFMPLLRLEDCEIALYYDDGINLQPLGILAEGADRQQGDISQEAESGHKQEMAYDGKKVLVTNQSEETGIVFQARIPRTLIMQEMRLLRVGMWGMLVICLVVEAGLGIFFARRYSLPLRNMIANLQRILKPETLDGAGEMQGNSGEEYAMLESGIKQIIQNNQKMETVLRRRETRDIQQFYQKLFLGGFSGEEEIQRQIEEQKLPVSAGDSCVAVWNADTEEEAEVLRRHLAGLGEIWVHRVQIIEKYLVVVLFTGEAMEYEAVIRLAQQMEDSMTALVGKNVLGGLGRAYQNLSDITFSYSQAVYCALLSESQRKQSLIVYEDVSQELNTLYYPAELEEKLLNGTKHGDSTCITEVFAAIYEENAVKRHLSRTMEGLLSANITATLLKVYHDVVPEEKMEEIISQKQGMGFEEMLEMQKQRFLEVGEELENSRKWKQDESGKRFAEYIEQHYMDAQLSVKLAAEAFGFSESYFSIVFKEAMGEAFSACLEKRRIAEAKVLLSQGLGVERVAELTGYNSSGTFRRAFKRMSGISPTEWRQR